MIKFSCSCGAVRPIEAAPNNVPLAALMLPCPECGVPGNGRVEQCAAAATAFSELYFAASTDRPMPVIRPWSVMESRAGDPVCVVSLWAGFGAGQVGQFDVYFDRRNWGITSLLVAQIRPTRRPAMRLSPHLLPPNLEDLARTIAMNREPVRDWQALVARATERKGGTR